MESITSILFSIKSEKPHTHQIGYGLLYCTLTIMYTGFQMFSHDFFSHSNPSWKMWPFSGSKCTFFFLICKSWSTGGGGDVFTTACSVEVQTQEAI